MPKEKQENIYYNIYRNRIWSGNTNYYIIVGCIKVGTIFEEILKICTRKLKQYYKKDVYEVIPSTLDLYKYFILFTKYLSIELNLVFAEIGSGAQKNVFRM